MKTEQEFFSDMEALVDDALRREPEIEVPAGFTDRTLAVMEKRIFWRELIMEFGYKCLIALGALLVFVLIFFFVSVKELTLLQSYLIHHWEFFAVTMVVGLFILFADQVFLKYLFKKYQTL